MLCLSGVLLLIQVASAAGHSMGTLTLSKSSNFAVQDDSCLESHFDLQVNCPCLVGN